jgi:hypothetical protein
MTVSPPAAVTSYTQITDDRVTALRAQAHMQSPVHAWIYQSPLVQSATVLAVDTAQDDPDLRDDLTAHSARDNVRHFLQQGGATGDHAYSAGPLGGALRCGWAPTEPAVPVCAWADGAMPGVAEHPGRRPGSHPFGQRPTTSGERPRRSTFPQGQELDRVSGRDAMRWGLRMSQGFIGQDRSRISPRRLLRLGPPR